MKIQKFEGATMRDAIAKVKAALGDQAVIVATRQIRRGLLGTGIEISAAIDQDDDEANLGGPMTGGPMSQYAQNSQPPAPAEPKGPDVETLLAPLRSEIRSLRALVRAGDNRNDVTALKKLVEELRNAGNAPAVPLTQAAGLTKRPATPRLVAPSIGNAIALVGPTGAGKTTTIAKLAARAALIEHRPVQLVTLDDYRVGGVEQIRTFAELIGVNLYVAPSPAELRALVADTNTLTLIDTAGRSPRDSEAIDELAKRLAGLDIEVHLVAPAAMSSAQLDSLAQRYRALKPVRLLVTKLDEVDTSPDLAKAPLRLELPITWITTGQAVPEDIEEPTQSRLVELAAHGLANGQFAKEAS